MNMPALPGHEYLYLYLDLDLDTDVTKRPEANRFLVSIDEAAAILRKSRTTLANMRDNKTLIPIIAVSGHQQFYSVSQLKEEPLVHPDLLPKPYLADPAASFCRASSRKDPTIGLRPAVASDAKLLTDSDPAPYHFPRTGKTPEFIDAAWALGAPYRAVIQDPNYSQRMYDELVKAFDFTPDLTNLPKMEDLTYGADMMPYMHLLPPGKRFTPPSNEANKRKEVLSRLPTMVFPTPIYRNGLYVGSRVWQITAAIPVLHYLRRLSSITIGQLHSDWYAKCLQSAALRSPNPRFEDRPENQPIFYWPVTTKQHDIFTVSMVYTPPSVGAGSLTPAIQSNGMRLGYKVASERTTATLVEYLNSLKESSGSPAGRPAGRPDPTNTFRLSEEEAWARCLFLPRVVPVPDDPAEHIDPVETIRMMQSYHLDWAVLNGEIKIEHARKAWALLSDESRLNASRIQMMIPTGDAR